MALDRRHVVHVTSAHTWTDNRIHYREARSLAAGGYRVTLIACSGGEGSVAEGVEVITLRRLPRLRRLVLGSARAVRVALRTKGAVVHLHDPELIWSIPLFKALGRSVIYDAHEDLPLQVQHKSYLSPLLRPVAVFVAHGLVRCAAFSDHVVAATEAVARRFEPTRTTVVRNLPPLRKAEKSAPLASQRPKRLGFVGAITRSRNMDVLVKAMEQPEFPDDWRLELAGSGPDSYIAELEGLAGWKLINYHGQLPSESARELLLGVRVGVILSAEKKAHLEALPTKMFEYFAAGIPVITSDFPLRREMMAKYECGLLVNPNDPAAVAVAVKRYADNPELLNQHAANARKAAVESFNWDVEVPKLLSVYETVLGVRS